MHQGPYLGGLRGSQNLGGRLLWKGRPRQAQENKQELRCQNLRQG
jgi:hypothetical protein